jgi:hypothetical protein
VETIRLVLEAAWKVLYVGLLLGAGLPVVFALGIRAMAGREDEVGSDGTVVAHPASAVARVLGVLCFALVLFGVAVGIMVIVGAGMGKVVSFEHVFPTLVPKP